MGSYAISEDDINLRGWTQTEDEDADVKVKVKVNGFRAGKGQKKSKTTETKKDGKTTKTTNYWYIAESKGNASMRIWGPTNEYKPPAKKKKNKKKKAKKKPAKEETNAFLSDVEISEEENTDADSDEPAGRYNLGRTYTYKTSTYSSSGKAYEQYKNEAPAFADDSRESFYNNMGHNINTQLNDFYGYNRKRDWVVFKRLKSKKHPEYKKFNDATDAIKVIMGKKKFNKSNDEIIAAVGPILDYFNSVADKYSKDDKHQKRFKSAAMFNSAQIYYYLDMTEEVKDIANKYIRWGHDKGIGEDFKEKAERLEHLLAFHGAQGRFYVTDENADDVWTEDIGDEPSDEEDEGNE